MASGARDVSATKSVYGMSENKSDGWRSLWSVTKHMKKGGKGRKGGQESLRHL